MIADQVTHAVVAVGGRRTAHHHRNNVAPVAVYRGDEIKARGAGISRFNAVDAAAHAKQMVVIAHFSAAIDEFLRGEILVVLRKLLLDVASEQRLIARGRVLIVIG